MNSLEKSFSYCERLAKSHYENFPVGSFLLPKNKRRYIWAIYAYARTADDFADEGRSLKETKQELSKRLSQLDDWEEKLNASVKGDVDHPIFMALRETILQCEIPPQLLKDLLTAYRMDVEKKRYLNFEEIFTYCRYSANPVGRLVLHTFGVRDESLFQLSDSICTALQLANFWQDIKIDLEKDRIYLPQDEMKKEGITDDDLKTGKVSPGFKRLVETCVRKTAQLFDEGLPLTVRVQKDLRFEMRLTWLGGTTILKRTVQNGYDIFKDRPALTFWDKFLLLSHALLPIPLKKINDELFRESN